MRFSAQERYALLGMFDLAYNGEGGAVQVRVIGERQGIPMRYLEQIFQRLRKAELVTAKRGPGGGFVLARSAEEIAVSEVLSAVEGLSKDLFVSDEPSAGGRTRYNPLFLGPLLTTRLRELFAGISLAELCQEANRTGVPSAGADAQMYHI